MSWVPMPCHERKRLFFFTHFLLTQLCDKDFNKHIIYIFCTRYTAQKNQVTFEFGCQFCLLTFNVAIKFKSLSMDANLGQLAITFY